MDKKTLDTLKLLQERLDMLINLTPSGEFRNQLTDENINVLTLINESESLIEEKFFQITSNGADDEFDGNQVLRLKAGDIGTLNIFRTEDRITVDVYSADDDDYVDSMSVTDDDLKLISCDNCKHINREDDLFCKTCVNYSNFDKYVD